MELEIREMIKIEIGRDRERERERDWDWEKLKYLKFWLYNRLGESKTSRMHALKESHWILCKTHAEIDWKSVVDFIMEN